MSGPVGANAMDWVAGVVSTGANPSAAPNHAAGSAETAMQKIRIACAVTGVDAEDMLTVLIADPRVEVVSAWGVADTNGGAMGALVGSGGVVPAAVASLEAALIERLDVLVYLGTRSGGEEDAVRYAVFALERGVNVLATCLPQMVEPLSAPPEQRRPLKDAAVVGQASFVATNDEPGIASLIPRLVAATPGVHSAASLNAPLRGEA